MSLLAAEEHNVRHLSFLCSTIAFVFQLALPVKDKENLKIGVYNCA
jgi:hypothetical protein